MGKTILKILHINTGQTGGASICAMRISNALKAEGVETKMLVQAGEPHDDVFVADKDKDFWNRNGFTLKIKHLLTRLGLLVDEDVLWYEREKALPGANDIVYTNVPLTSYKNIAHHPLVEWADVIHLHWVACLVDYPTFFKEVKKPIVWTMHDKFVVQGLMHFHPDYKTLPQELMPLDKKCREIKRKGMLQSKKLTLVCISEMMKHMSESSDVTKGIPCTIIHNGVDTSVFLLHNRVMCRQKYRILETACVFLFSSYNLCEKNKGLDRLISAIEKVDIPNKILVCLGKNEDILPDANFPIFQFGLMKDVQSISEIYSMSDFFLQASYDETFSQTSLEAMSCGTPVISTPCSGASDLIRDFNGVVCDGFEVEDLVNGIKTALGKTYNRDQIRQHIIENFEYSIIAKQYKNLYAQVLK